MGEGEWTSEAQNIAEMLARKAIEMPWKGAQTYVANEGKLGVESRHGMAVWFLGGDIISKADAVRLIEARLLSLCALPIFEHPPRSRHDERDPHQTGE